MSAWSSLRPPVLVVSLTLVVACDRSKVEEPARPASTATTAASAPAPASSAPAFSARYSRPSPARLVAIGDLHGDLEATRAVLRLAGAIDAKDAWAGGALVLVQTGDEIDRGDADRAILDLFERLTVEAKAAGGEVLALVGNHEVMNAQQDYRYVTPAGREAFGPEGRAAAFSPGGSYAKKLASRPVVVKVGDDVFVHGGVLPKHIAYGLDRANDETRDFFLGRGDAPRAVTQEDGLTWTRMYSAAPGPEECAVLDEALAKMGAKRMIVGHTVQRNGISPACGDKVFRIDTGMSKFYAGKIEALEIKAGVAKILGSL